MSIDVAAHEGELQHLDVSLDGAAGDRLEFTNMGRVTLHAAAKELSGHRVSAPALTVIVEGSDDGVSWSTVHAFPLTRASQDQAWTGDCTSAFLRMSWSVGSGTWGVPSVAVIPFVAATSGAGGGGSQTDVPQADPTGFDIDTTTYDNPITGSGKLTTLVAKAAVNGGDTAVLAVAVEGDAFPRVLLESTGDGLYMGDGTFDPYDVGAGVATLNQAGSAAGELFSPHGSFIAGNMDDPDRGAYNKSSHPLWIVGGMILLNPGDPNGQRGGTIGDLYVRTEDTPDINHYFYRCTTGGDAATAVWTPIGGLT